jgi:hypothetical protein
VEEGKAGLVVISVLLVVGRRRSEGIVVDGGFNISKIFPLSQNFPGFPDLSWLS